MKTAIVGSGGREHALGHYISRDPLSESVYFIPGNGGTVTDGINVNINPKETGVLIDFLRGEGIEFVVIGPEDPLVSGLADLLRENGITVFGPSAKAARIESEKSFAKALMSKYGVPTASYMEFSAAEYDKCREYVKTQNLPFVIKADGLAAGKGVFVCSQAEEAEKALKLIFEDRIFGDSGNRVLIEEFMEGEEISVFAVSDGKDYIVLPAAQDHKRIGEGDTGDNTGGMGAYAPAPQADDELMLRIKNEIIRPMINGMAADGIPFQGCLYCGLMLTKDGPRVVEFNCRFGDPETQVVLSVLEGSLLKLLHSAASGRIDKKAVTAGNRAAVCVIAASSGYPWGFKKGFEIKGLDDISENSVVFHAGTSISDDKIITSGGRVFAMTSISKNGDLKAAVEQCYDDMSRVGFDNIYYRKDIAHRALKLL